ncbi:Uncharacterised protein [Klebsiella pneumoniae]|nr:Uncharacterised protein [Klebsiella pneumoniae]
MSCDPLLLILPVSGIFQRQCILMSENPLLLELLNQCQLLRVLVGQLLHRVNFSKCLLVWVNHLLRAYFGKVGLMLLLHLLSGCVVFLQINLPGVKRRFQVLHGFSVGFILSLFRNGIKRLCYPLRRCGCIPCGCCVFGCFLDLSLSS